MDNKTILEQAIQKAIDGGWWNQIKNVTWHDPEDPQELIDLYFKDGSVAEGMNIEAIIFNHDFAKALWRDATLTNKQVWLESLWSAEDEYPSFDGEPWQYHLQQMVIADDPIKYLGENIS